MKRISTTIPKIVFKGEVCDFYTKFNGKN